ncbi:hypothetical protein J2741_001576 [Methanolinea mesophila]|uniref:PEGA domain-containing protein n=1 Tax=Methanolinea mesophila TaxID=547055 RepID=UPI001AE56349|nr:PEGA domain-containing protein [Methanolinea mesophila]MBP1929029.1 hypothetical protein [Methanolinea mesophila]
MATGTLQVSGNPTAAGVYIDDVLRGIPPLTITGIPQAVHTVEGDKEGYQRYLAQISILGGNHNSIEYHPLTLPIAIKAPFLHFSGH